MPWHFYVHCTHQFALQNSSSIDILNLGNAFACTERRTKKHGSKRDKKIPNNDARPMSWAQFYLERQLRFTVDIFVPALPARSVFKTLFAAVLFFLIAESPQFASAATVDGKTIFTTTCIACHGSKGEGNVKIGAPNFAGMDATYLTRQLANFSSGLRGAAPNDSYGAQMRASVAVLKTDADRAAVAAYITSLQKVPSNTVIKSDLANGRTQFNAVCSSCHESRAQGNLQMGAPNLQGLEPAYIERQVLAFRNGTRGANPADKPGALMKVGASMLPDDKSAHDVAGYITTLK
jgi:cytochrome c oxidase subunit 2